MASMDGEWQCSPPPRVDAAAARGDRVCEAVGLLVAVAHVWWFVRGDGTLREWASLAVALAAAAGLLQDCRSGGCPMLATVKLLLALLIADVLLPCLTAAGSPTDEDAPEEVAY